MIELRDYQIENSDKIVKRLLKLRIAYLAAEVRTGKTLTALHACKVLMNTQPTFNVLFITKKKAIGSIESDAIKLNVSYNLVVVNYESIHKVETPDRWDVIICDELHCVGSFPKQSARHKNLKTLFDKWTYLIALSGTPHPESKAQLFHQLNISPHSPWADYNFYQWAKKYCNVYQVNYGYGLTNKYDRVIDQKVDDDIKPYMITYTQEKAGFDKVVSEHTLNVPMKGSTIALIERLKKDRVIEGKNGLVLADTAVKLQNKIHQICSGTIKYEDGTSMSFDYSKGEFIRKYFEGKKIAIFYYYKEELNLLINIYKGYNIVYSPEQFNDKDKNTIFLGQIRSSREGINLSSADALVFYNIEFSCVSYIQARDRATSKDRDKANDVYFIFSEGGIEEKIYDTVRGKKDYSNAIFKKDFEIKDDETSQLSLL